MAKERILVVDDEPDVLRICERVLRGAGYVVSTVGSGFEAVRLASIEPYDCLLTDIKMPGMDGLDVASSARTVNPNLVCVTMTGYSSMDTAIEALRLGIDEFLIKPFNPQDLLLTVERALEKERLRRESARLRALVPLFEANRVFMSTTDTVRLAEQVVNTAVRELGADRASLFLKVAPQAGGDSEELVAVARHGLGPEDLAPWSAYAEHALHADMADWLVSSGRSGGAESLTANSVSAARIYSKQGPVGVLILARDTRSHPFGEGDSEFLSVLCSQAGIALENALLFQELRRAYDELKQLDYMKSEFISIAAHELRTPLAILMGYAGILEGMVAAEQKQFASIIVRNAQRLRALMDEMLNLESLERGASFVRLEAMDLREVVTEVAKDLRPMADNCGHTVTLTLPDENVRLVTDREKFVMVLTNLLSNAIKFTPDGGQIRLQATRRNDLVQVSVQDDGIGIAPSDQSRVFERFYQVEASLSRQHDGLGLGLSIAKGMVELLGGRIWVESEVGQGTTFHFTVPLRPRSTPDETPWTP